MAEAPGCLHPGTGMWVNVGSSQRRMGPGSEAAVLPTASGILSVLVRALRAGLSVTDDDPLGSL